MELIYSRVGLGTKIKIMDIGRGKGYPTSALSNFAPHPFVIDGVECTSMEGFLQSLKFKAPDMQRVVCTLVGMAAKKKGAGKDWKKRQTLFWQGVAIDRHAEAYQHLLDRAFDALAENDGFKRALLATGNASLIHSIGKADPHDTVLTRREFCGRLERIRERLTGAISKK
jgi:predicted NAD-dependent protein-ADP-ribosyltransferase YbiA (DUF1768 family)